MSRVSIRKGNSKSDLTSRTRESEKKKKKSEKIIACRQKEGVLVIDVSKMRRLIPENKA